MVPFFIDSIVRRNDFLTILKELAMFDNENPAFSQTEFRQED